MATKVLYFTDCRTVGRPWIKLTPSDSEVMIRYDTYNFTCAQKLTLWRRQLNLAHGTETNNNEKLKTNGVAQKKPSGQ